MLNRIIIAAIFLLLPSTLAETSHSPEEVTEGDTFSTILDTEDDVTKVTFYVCTLEEPYTCYKPIQKLKNESENGRFEFSYTVRNNDYPGYKYEIEKEDNSTEKIPASEYSYYEGMNVVKMQESYYFKVDVASQEQEESGAMLYAPNLILTLSIISVMALINRR